jgi:LysR family glycine cleavage system transcriptional activator
MDSRSLPPLPWLRTFEAAARTMSFTAAAFELGVTQSAVSQQIRRLEESFGRPLFHRLPRGLRLTEAGEQLLPLLGDTFARLAAGTAEIFGEREVPQLLVRSTAGFSMLWMAPRLGHFRARNPEIEFRLTSSIWVAEYLDPSLDFEIRYGDGAWPGARVERLTADELFPVMSPKLTEGSARLAAPADLARATLLHCFGFSEGWPHWLAAAGVADKVDGARGLEFDLSLLALELAERGGGVALGRTSYVEDRLASGRLVAPFAERIKAGEDFYLIEPVGRKRTRAGAAFRDWLLDETSAARCISPARAAKGRAATAAKPRLRSIA